MIKGEGKEKRERGGGGGCACYSRDLNCNTGTVFRACAKLIGPSTQCIVGCGPQSAWALHLFQITKQAPVILMHSSLAFLHLHCSILAIKMHNKRQTIATAVFPSLAQSIWHSKSSPSLKVHRRAGVNNHR